MSSVSLTLKDVFDAPEIQQERLGALAAGAGLASLRHDLARSAPNVDWSATVTAIMQGTDEILDVPLPDVAVSAWSKYQLLEEYADARKHPPSETNLVPLATHVIRSVHHPSVQVLVGDRVVGTIKFEVAVELTVEGVLLGIRAGRIMEIRLGSCQAAGSVSCAGIVIMERETKALVWPEAIELREGIPVTLSRHEQSR